MRPTPLPRHPNTRGTAGEMVSPTIANRRNPVFCFCMHESDHPLAVTRSGVGGREEAPVRERNELKRQGGELASITAVRGGDAGKEKIMVTHENLPRMKNVVVLREEGIIYCPIAKVGISHDGALCGPSRTLDNKNHSYRTPFRLVERGCLLLVRRPDLPRMYHVQITPD